MSHMDLMSYYKLIFSLTQFHKWSITEVENLMPYEREVYVIMLNQHIEEEEQKAKSQAQ
jgi:hypothetical protein